MVSTFIAVSWSSAWTKATVWWGSQIFPISRKPLGSQELCPRTEWLCTNNAIMYLKMLLQVSFLNCHLLISQHLLEPHFEQQQTQHWLQSTRVVGRGIISSDYINILLEAEWQSGDWLQTADNHWLERILALHCHFRCFKEAFQICRKMVETF